MIKVTNKILNKLINHKRPSALVPFNKNKGENKI